MDRIKRGLVLLGVSALSCALLIPGAAVAAGEAKNPRASASASTKKQVKKLAKQVRRLKRQLADLDSVQGPSGEPGEQGEQGPPGEPGSDASIEGVAAGGDLTGTFPNPTIAPFAVTGSKIADGAVGTSELANSAVSTAKIGDGAVSTAKIANTAVSEAKLANGAATTNKIGDGAVSTAKIANTAVTTDKIVNGAVNSAKVANGALTMTDFAGVNTITLIDPPNLAAGACLNDSEPLAGVNVGDLLMTAPVDTAADGLVATPLRAVTAGQFRYRICNVSGGAVNDISRVYGLHSLR